MGGCLFGRSAAPGCGFGFGARARAPPLSSAASRSVNGRRGRVRAPSGARGQGRGRAPSRAVTWAPPLLLAPRLRASSSPPVGHGGRGARGTQRLKEKLSLSSRRHPEGLPGTHAPPPRRPGVETPSSARLAHAPRGAQPLRARRRAPRRTHSRSWCSRGAPMCECKCVCVSVCVRARGGTQSWGAGREGEADMGRSALAPGALRARWTGDPLAGNLERTGVAPFLRALTTGFRAKRQAPTSSATLAPT